MLSLTPRNVGVVTVLDAAGALTAGIGLQTLRQQIERLVAERQLKIVLNAGQVSVIDSSGVGDLVASFSLLKRQGGALKIASPNTIVRDVLRIAQLPKLIEIHETEDAAVNSFASQTAEP